MFPPAGSFYNYYQHYDYTYISSGVILIVASLFLFAGMGINYNLLAREKKKKDEEKGEPKEERDAMLAPAQAQVDQEGGAAAVKLEEDSKVDENTV